MGSSPSLMFLAQTVTVLYLQYVIILLTPSPNPSSLGLCSFFHTNRETGGTFLQKASLSAANKIAAEDQSGSENGAGVSQVSFNHGLTVSCLTPDCCTGQKNSPRGPNMVFLWYQGTQLRIVFVVITRVVREKGWFYYLQVVNLGHQ